MEVEVSRLEFSLVEPEFKAFRSCLRSMSKIGAELMVQATPNEVQFNVMSNSSTAHLTFTCTPHFFQSYAIFGCTVLTAVVPFKNVLAPFRSKKVDTATFELSVAESRLSVTLECENGLCKRYSFPTLDKDIIMVDDASGLPVSVVAEPASLLKYLSTFHSGVEEVSLLAHPRAPGGGSGAAAAAVELRSFADPSKGHSDQALQAQLTLFNTLSFVSYRNSLDHAVEIVFNIKDFRAVLTLAEQVGSHVELTFREPKQPLLVATHFPAGHLPAVRARLVLSTMDNAWDGRATQAELAARAHGGQQRQQPAPSQPMPIASEDLGEAWGVDGMEEEPGIASTPPDEMGARLTTMPGHISAPQR